MAKRKQLYSQKPAVSAKRVAGTNPVGKVSIGSGTPGMVPEKAGYSKGLSPKKDFHQPKPHGINRTIRSKKGHKIGKT